VEVSEQLVIKDRNGVPRIVLTAGASIAEIVVSGDSGAEAVVEAGDQRTGLVLRRSGGRDSVRVASDDGAVNLVLFDQECRPRVVLSYDPKESVCTLKVRDQDARAYTRVIVQ
jgi:hypothetical protein